MKKDMYAWGKWWVPIYATKIHEDHIEQQTTWSRGKLRASKESGKGYIDVFTAYGPDRADCGDWVIQVQSLFYVLTDEVFDDAFYRWDARAGGNTDFQEWKVTPRQITPRRKVKENHGHVIRIPGSKE